MDAPYLLILGGSDDRQLNDVVGALREQGVAHVFADHAGDDEFALTATGDGTPRFHFNGVEKPTPALVWCRLKINTIMSYGTKLLPSNTSIA